MSFMFKSYLRLCYNSLDPGPRLLESHLRISLIFSQFLTYYSVKALGALMILHIYQRVDETLSHDTLVEILHTC
jgi:hypothetical protein